MGHHNGLEFSTKDKDNDRNSTGSCAIKHHGAWWYGACHAANLNGKYLHGSHTSYSYGDGVNWYTWKGYEYSMKTTEMKIRRK